MSVSEFNWENFKACFVEKFPYSILAYPCLPCASDDSANILWYASFILLGLFFLVKILYRSNLIMSDFLDRNIWTVYYFMIIYTFLVTSIIIFLNLHNDKNWISVIFNSLGFGLLFFVSTFVSVKFYDYLVYFPIFGQLIYRLTQILENWVGVNTPRILVGWWGVSLSPLVALIPLIGPFIAGILMFIPQNLFLMWLGYIMVCLV